jgi:nucleoside-diphosphate-sugar epimerase
MKHLLITGSRGFVGSFLKERLIRQGFPIIEIDGPEDDILDKQTFEKYLDCDISHVFHLAAKTFVPESWTKPLEFYQTNVMGTANVLDFCRIKKAHITYVSAYLYGQPSKLPIAENDAIIPNNPYAHSKYLAEQLCAFYAREFDLNVTIIRPFNIYGIGQNEKFLIPYLVRQALHDKTIGVKDLYPKRDYVYIDDVIDAFLLTMHRQSALSVYNIGSGTSYSVKEVIDMIQDIMQCKKQIVSENVVRKNEMNDVIADITLAKNNLLWSPRHSLREGIEKIIHYEQGK